MAKKSNPTEGAASKARRSATQSGAIIKRPKASTARPTTPEPSEGENSETSRAILEAARTEMHSGLAELYDALRAVIRWSNALEQSLAIAQRITNTLPGGISYLGPNGLVHGMRLPQSVLCGEWGARWNSEYRKWVLSIRAAMDAVGRPSVAAIMDPNSHPHPALCWTALVRDALTRLQASLHPMKEGADGKGFLRAGANSLPASFMVPLDRIRKTVTNLEAVATTFTPVAEAVVGAQPETPEHVCDSTSAVNAGAIDRAAERAAEKTARVFGGGDDNGHAKRPALPAGADESAGPALTVNQSRVLQTMARLDASRLESADAIAAEMNAAGRLSARTIGPIVRRLIELRLAERPEGDRGGARLTMAGRRLAAKIAD